MEPCPLHQKQGVLTTGPPEKSPEGNNFRKNHLPEVNWEFPGGPMFRTWWFLWGGSDLIPGQKTKIVNIYSVARKKINYSFYKSLLNNCYNSALF